MITLIENGISHSLEPHTGRQAMFIYRRDGAVWDVGTIAGLSRANDFTLPLWSFQGMTIFTNDCPVGYFKAIGEYGKPTLYVLQGLNRVEFLSNLLALLPDFCRENCISQDIVLAIVTDRELAN